MTDKKPVRKNDKQTVPMSAHGKMPPSAVDVEKQVLGMILMAEANYLIAKEILKPDSFYMDENKLVFEAMELVYAREIEINLATVTIELRKMGKLDFVGGAYYISGLTQEVFSTANIEYHCLIVQQKYMARKLIYTCTELIGEAYDDTKDVFDLLEGAENVISNLTNYKMLKRAQKAHEALVLLHGDSTKPKTDNFTIGVPTGFTAHDKQMGHMIPADLIILAARPGMGKTSLAVGIGKTAAKRFKKPTMVFSLEMTNMQLAARLIAPEVKVPVDQLLNGRATAEVWEHVAEGLDKYKDMPLYMDDTAEMTITELATKAKRAKMLLGIELIIVDYLQLLSGVSENRKNELSREQEISKISRGLKKLAKQLNIPIIALSQLSRGVEERKDKRPLLSDLRESGSIEADADRVWFLYRPEYYGEKKAKIFGVEIDTIGVCEWIVAKNRNGDTGTIYLDFEGQYTSFGDWIPGLSDQRAQRATERKLQKTGEQLQNNFMYPNASDEEIELPF